MYCFSRAPVVIHRLTLWEHAGVERRKYRPIARGRAAGEEFVLTARMNTQEILKPNKGIRILDVPE